MADVDAQLEANGLPTQFESSANQPEVSHAVINTEATISNAEASSLKENAPGLDVVTTAEPVQPPEQTESQPTETDNVTMANGGPATQATTTTHVNGHSAPSSDDVVSSQPTASVANTSLEASTQSQANDSVTTLDSSILSNTFADSVAQPDQAPVSDLRSAPHSDQLTPEAVAQKEAEKHAMDNNADAPQEPATTILAPETDKVTALPHADQIMEEAKPISPPPPPEPSHATLPIQSPKAEVPAAVPAEVVDASVNLKPEQPAAPAPTPAVEADHEMTDVPTLPVKAVREREDDNDIEEPVAKRARTDEDHPMTEPSSFKVPESPAPPATSEPSGPVDPDDEVTTPRLQHMKKVISNLKKSNASAAFRLPVDPIALKIPTYFDFVKTPMDLGTIDNKLKKNEYKSVQAFRTDFHQIIQNCLLFNGPDHAITQSGRKMESSFTNQMAHLPPTTSSEPPKMDKKPVKPKIEPPRASVSRRQSMSTKAASPTAASPATFAVNPESGLPLIRRDSTVDGRPKRAIIPTKRNSDFGGARPKKKKYELELRFCDETLKNIMSSKHWAVNQYFMHPVDPVALNIPQYFQVIKKPMDLGTVRQKLDGGHYEKAKDFEEDVRLIFKNCYKFNPEGDYVHGRGQELEKLFNQEFGKKREWMAAREPDSEPASVGDDDGEEVSDEDAEAESEEDERKTQLQQLEAQLEAIKNQMGELKQQTTKNKSPSVGAKKSDKKKVKKEAPKSQFPNLPKSKTKKPATKSKSEKDRYVTFAEKQYISNGIAMLPERPMAEALKIIQNSVPALANSDQGEIELDIEEVPNHALLKLLAFVKKYAGPPPDESREQEYAAPTVSKTKKGKTMSRQDQDAQIAELRGTLHHYQEGISPEAVQSIETGAEDSDDDDESNEESEEE